MSYFQKLISADSTADAKAFVTLVMAGHFILTSFAVSIFTFFMIVYTPKGSVNKELVDLLKSIMEQDFWIIVSGFGFMGASEFGQAMVQRAVAKAQGPADIIAQPGSAITQTDTVNAKNVETVNSQNTNIAQQGE